MSTNGTTLDVTLSAQLQTELSQAGVYAYAVVFDKAGGNTAIEPVATLVSDGTVQDGGNYAITLTDGTERDAEQRQGLFRRPEHQRG